MHFVDGVVKEMFDFVEVERITGQVLAQTILQWLSTHGLSLADIRGQCYDGASNMSGAVSGWKSRGLSGIVFPLCYSSTEFGSGLSL